MPALISLASVAGWLQDGPMVQMILVRFIKLFRF
jgi:hypothetical protein